MNAPNDRPPERDERIARLEAILPSLATRADLADLKGELTTQMAQLEGKLTTQLVQLEGRLSAQLALLDGRLLAQMAQGEGKVDQMASQLRQEMNAQTWRLVTWVSSVCVVLAGGVFWIARTVHP